MNDSEKVEQVLQLLNTLRKKAYAHWGSCATGLKDYQHSHGWASDCSACGERSEAGRVVELLEKALGVDFRTAPCFATDYGWCVRHHREVTKCKKK